jgi:hypothetical protein
MNCGALVIVVLPNIKKRREEVFTEEEDRAVATG